ncbi:MAG: hypothetical protein J1E32_00800 [Treponema sp.]|nr:hypothetical protein [Treponema sp.]
MRNRTIYFYVAASLATVVPVPGRLAFGLLMVVLFNIQVVTGVLTCHLAARLKLDDLQRVIVSVELIAITILYKQLVMLVCPVAALTLGFLIYLPALSSAVIEFSYKNNVGTLAEDLKEKAARNGVFSAVALALFFVRDTIGFGTVTFPAWQRIAAAHLPVFPGTAAVGAFLATVPGAFVLAALLLALYLFVTGQFARIARAGGGQ